MFFTKKTIIFFLILLKALTSFGQSVDVFGGMISNHFFSFGKDGHIESEYLVNPGYTLGIGLEDIKLDYLNMRFTLSFQDYSGDIIEKYSGLAGGSTTEVNFSKSTITLGLFPINFYLFNHVDLNFGLSLSRLLTEDFGGSKSGCYGNPNGGYDCFQIDLIEEYESFSSNWNFGIQARIGYDFYLSETLVLSPIYFFYLGLSDEFSDIVSNSKLMGHYLCIGIEKRIGK